MAYSPISKSTNFFNTKLYTGTGNDNLAITGIGFKPDWIWAKDRDGTDAHHVADAVNGAGYRLRTNTAGALGTQADGVKSFDSDGFTVGTTGSVNTNGHDFVAWNWKAGNSAGSSNTNGSITSTVSVNTTSKFSVVKWTGSGANATIGHGLGAVPKMIIVKNLSSYNWNVYHNSLGATKNMVLNEAEDVETQSYWQDTTPTSNVFYVNNNGNVNQSSTQMIAYCFGEVSGFSKVGKYLANNNSDGSFIWTGFSPKFLMVKQSNANGNPWGIVDATRNLGNPTNEQLFANTNGAKNTSVDVIDLLSNGFKCRAADNTWNGEAGGNKEYIYIAFGQSLVGSNNVPCTAR